ncbi:MAG TPA: twin-arginine translocation signal domain-containing protein, partial [Acidobacteriota bacterium]|nr:twin-arginine translocation signal domain-containing protein [Acidobacteriota bacterium]
MRRRDFVKASAALAGASALAPRSMWTDVPDHLWEGYKFGSPQVTNRLDQGPFGITQDEGWFTIFATQPSRDHIRNFGTGLVGYSWEENGPALGVSCGRETLEQSIEKMASLPFVDVLYIRCDWRDVQTKPGQLNLSAVWETTFDAAKRHNLGVGFRIQMSSPNIQPQKLSIPDFLREKVPVVNIGHKSTEHRTNFDFYEPRYDAPEFQKAFAELNDLLAAKFGDDPRLEYMDLMMYGFWGEGHTNDIPSPFPDYLTAEKTFVGMTQLQIETWKKTPLAVNTQPDISNVGNRQVQDLAVRSGCWLRSDSLIMDEPIQIEELGHRPPWLATVLEDGANRHHVLPEYAAEEQACLSKLPGSMLTFVGQDNEGQPADDYPHRIGGPIARPYRESAGFHALDIGSNYFGLWTEADNVRRYYERYPDSLHAMEQRLGYRVRPSLVWQRKRYDTMELILGIVNDGVAGVPGVLGINAESLDGRIKVGGNFDAGQPYAGQLREASIILPKGMDGQQIILRAELEVKGVRRPVRWA